MTFTIDAILAVLQKRVPMRTARALSRTVMELVADEVLPAGTRMPTVRSVASALGISPSSVAQAWGELVGWHVLETRRRGGTFVLGPPKAPRATRFDAMMRASAGFALNLGHLVPDIGLLPPLAPAFAAAASREGINEPTPTPISAALHDAVAPGWPFRASAFLATHGGVDAADLALRTSIRPGDRVIVENPGVSRVLDIVESIGATVIPVDYRRDGPDLDQLAHALRLRPAAFVYQPVGQSPTGFRVSGDWLDRAADLLRNERIPIIEKVQTPLLETRPIVSLGSRLPQAVVHIQSYNFFFGPNLRVGVVGGSDFHIDRMWLQLTYSSRWVSRLLQDALAHQLTDPAARQHLFRFISTCHQRHHRLTAALQQAGFPIAHHDGPLIWLPVPNEHVVTTQLSSRGIVVHPGSYFSPTPLPQAHVLLNGTAMIDRADEIAGHLAAAASIK